MEIEREREREGGGGRERERGGNVGRESRRGEKRLVYTTLLNWFGNRSHANRFECKLTKSV